MGCSLIRKKCWMFQLLKAREAGKTVVFFDYESSVDQNKYFSTNQDQRIES